MGSRRALVPLTKYKCLQRLSETAAYKSAAVSGAATLKPEGSVAEVGARPADEKRMSVSRAQLFSVTDEATDVAAVERT